MSRELEQARLIAERIARRVSGSEVSSIRGQSGSGISAELASLRATLSELQKRLVHLEATVRSEPNAPSTSASSFAPVAPGTERPVPLLHSPWLAGGNPTAAHPSQEAFGVEEAVVSELVDFFEKEKTCSIEPGGRPCDHCAMCSTRGF